MAQTNVYNPKKYIGSFAGIRLRGFADGDAIAVSRSADGVTKTVGSQGDVVFAMNADESGEVTITLQASSPCNTQLSALYNAARLAGTIAYGPFSLVDLNGATVCDAPVAVIRKPADVTVGQEHGNRVWILDCAELNMVITGNTGNTASL